MRISQVLVFWLVLLVGFRCTSAQSGHASDSPIVFRIDTSITYQTMHNFGASDAWSIQNIGTDWPVEVRERVAELLFSTENDRGGQPKGVGLTAWRFNIGAGSAEQGKESGIRSDWRRAECFMDSAGDYDWSKQAGQQWFLKEAAKYEVEDVIAFVNSPPVYFTKNNKAWSEDGLSSNLKPEYYKDYADFLVTVVKGLESNTGVKIDYLSPFNEPQWEWKCCKQEGTPWNNDELAKVTRFIDLAFTENDVTHTKIEITENAQIDFLYEVKSPTQRSNQLEEFFTKDSDNSLLNLNHLAPKICGHSYFSTWDKKRLVESRIKFWNKLQSINPELEYWATEYCLLEDNEEVVGPGKDLGIDPALYNARVIHTDLVFANSSTWQWWLAVSVGDYKDGLVYLDPDDKLKVEDSKLMWALGNYSRFIRPGSIRINIESDDERYDSRNLVGPMVSSFLTPEGEIIVVMINEEDANQSIKLEGFESQLDINLYTTAEGQGENLKPSVASSKSSIILPARSVVTCVIH